MALFGNDNPTRRPVKEIIASFTSLLDELKKNQELIDSEADTCQFKKDLEIKNHTDSVEAELLRHEDAVNAERTRHGNELNTLDFDRQELEMERTKSETIIKNLTALIATDDD